LASKNPAPCATCKNGENNDSNTIKNDPEDQFDLIREAITHLVSIKDILDELGILKSLVKDQKKVWHDAFSEYTIEEEYMNSREPSEILEALDEMVADATRVERSVSIHHYYLLLILLLTYTDKRSFGSKAEAGQLIRSTIVTHTGRRNSKPRLRNGKAR
jgi:hypothetical protein